MSAAHVVRTPASGFNHGVPVDQQVNLIPFAPSFIRPLESLLRSPDTNRIQLGNTMRPSSIFVAIIATVALPLITACGAAGNHDGHSMAQITATIEKAGFTCKASEKHPKRFAEVSGCRSNKHKYLKLIVNRWNDPKARDQMYKNTIPKVCKQLGMKDQVHWSTAGSWTLVAGSGKARDIKALDEAAKALGFKSHTVPCQ